MCINEGLAVKKLICTICLLLIVLLLTGCSSREKDVDDAIGDDESISDTSSDIILTTEDKTPEINEDLQSPSSETEQNRTDKRVVAQFTQVGLFDHDCYADWNPNLVPHIKLYEDFTFEFLCNYDGGTALYSGGWYYNDTIVPLEFFFTIENCEGTNGIDQQTVYDVLSYNDPVDFIIKYNTARCDADFCPENNASFGLTIAKDVLFHVELTEGYVLDDFVQSYIEPELPEEENYIDVDLGIIGHPASVLLDNYKYNGGIIYTDWHDNFFENSHSVYDLALTGEEEVYFLYDDFMTVTALDGLIVGFTHEEFRYDYNGNTYQLLQSLGGNFGLLVNYEPEIIEGDTGEIYLRWETKDAVFVISAFWSVDLGDWKATLPETYCIFARS